MPVRPIPWSDESPNGYLVRMAEGNGYLNASRLLFALGFGESWQWDRLFEHSRDRYGAVLESCGIDVSVAESLCYQRIDLSGGSKYLINDSVLDGDILDSDLESYCSLCLLEHRYWRKIWRVRTYVACVKHNVLMRKQCFVCQRDLAQNRPELIRCQCGADLTNAPAIRANSSATEWFMSLGRQDPRGAREVARCFLALLQMEGGQRDTRVRYAKLRAVQEWYSSRAYSPSPVDSVASHWHPRLELLPVLEEASGQCVTPLSSGVSTINDVILDTLQAAGALGVDSRRIGQIAKTEAARSVGLRLPNGSYSARAINGILWRLTPNSEVHEGWGRKVHTSRLASAVQAVFDGSRISRGFDLLSGIRTLATSAINDD